MSVNKRGPTPIQLNDGEIERRYAAGESMRAIAARMHVSPPVIQRRLVARGIHIRSSGEATRIRFRGFGSAPTAQSGR